MTAQLSLFDPEPTPIRCHACYWHRDWLRSPDRERVDVCLLFQPMPCERLYRAKEATS